MNRFFLTLFVLTAAMYPHRAWCQSLDSIYGIHLYSPDDHHEREQIREVRNKGITYKAIYQYIIDSSGREVDSSLISQYAFGVLPNQTLKEISVNLDSEALSLPDSMRIDTFVYDPYDRYIFSKTHKWTAITIYQDSLGYATRRWIFANSESVDSFIFDRAGDETFIKRSGWREISTYDSTGELSGGKVWDAHGRLSSESTIQTEKVPSGTIETTLETMFADSTANTQETRKRIISVRDYQKHQWTLSNYDWTGGQWKLQRKNSYDSTLRAMVIIDSNRGTVIKTWTDDHDSTLRGELNGKLVYTKLRAYDKNGMPLSTLESRPAWKGRKVRTDYYYQYGKKE
jgi:hypothetical protein